MVQTGNSDQAVGDLMQKYRVRLEKVIQFRMDRRLKSRLDASDIVQEAFFEAIRRLDDFHACSEKMSFFLWLRFLTMQKLYQMHRHHLGVAARDAGRDIPIHRQESPQATSVVLAAQLLGDLTSPSHAAQRKERKEKLELALEEIDELDREVLALRHFEQLSNSETAQLLNIKETAASNRYIRALKRLKSVLEKSQDGASVFFSRDR